MNALSDRCLAWNVGTVVLAAFETTVSSVEAIRNAILVLASTFTSKDVTFALRRAVATILHFYGVYVDKAETVGAVLLVTSVPMPPVLASAPGEAAPAIARAVGRTNGSRQEVHVGVVPDVAVYGSERRVLGHVHAV